MTQDTSQQKPGNRYAWIIGASSGIGRALAAELHKRGWNLLLSARNKAALEDLNRDLGGLHDVFPMDVTDHRGFKKTAKAVFSNVPRLDRMIFMSGVYTPMKTDDLDIDAARQIVEVNLMGVLNAVEIILPILEKQAGGGQASFCASVSAYRGLPGSQPYAATKAAVNNLAETLRLEYQERGVDIRVINPGFVRTPMTDKNDFDMPMIISPEAAAIAISDGLDRKTFDINFPKKFTLILRLLRILPDPVYFWAIKKIIG